MINNEDVNKLENLYNKMNQQEIDESLEPKEGDSEEILLEKKKKKKGKKKTHKQHAYSKVRGAWGWGGHCNDSCDGDSGGDGGE